MSPSFLYLTIFSLIFINFASIGEGRTVHGVKKENGREIDGDTLKKLLEYNKSQQRHDTDNHNPINIDSELDPESAEVNALNRNKPVYRIPSLDSMQEVTENSVPTVIAEDDIPQQQQQQQQQVENLNHTTTTTTTTDNIASDSTTTTTTTVNPIPDDDDPEEAEIETTTLFPVEKMEEIGVMDKLKTPVTVPIIPLQDDLVVMKKETVPTTTTTTTTTTTPVTTTPVTTTPVPTTTTSTTPKTTTSTSTSTTTTSTTTTTTTPLTTTSTTTTTVPPTPADEGSYKTSETTVIETVTVSEDACSEGSVKQEGCNMCICIGGAYFCSKRECPVNSESVAAAAGVEDQQIGDDKLIKKRPEATAIYHHHVNSTQQQTVTEPVDLSTTTTSTTTTPKPECSGSVTKSIDCNLCVCSPYGRWACTKRSCIALTLREKASYSDGSFRNKTETLLENPHIDDDCTEGESRKWDCNSCVCFLNSWSCTDHKCPSTTPKPKLIFGDTIESCDTENDIKSVECNVCHCTRGIWICSKNDCKKIGHRYALQSRSKFRSSPHGTFRQPDDE